MLSKFFGTDSFMDMLGTPSFWFTIVLIFGFIAVFVFCIKYWKQGGGWAIFSLFTIVLVVITGYSIINLNAYYNSKGGIYGAITGIFNTNEVEVVSDVEYSFSNIELVQVGDSDVYSATITLPEVFELANGQDYMVYVNDMPCKYEENASDYVLADYGYVFYDEDFNVLMEDTLHFRFAFYTNSTSLKVSTYGGAEAVRYWNYYFNKNTFVVKLAEVDGITISGDINFAEGDVSNYCTVSYSVNSESYAVQLYRKGQTLKLLDLPEDYISWLLPSGEAVIEDYVVTGDLLLYADYKYCTIKYMVNDELYCEKVYEKGTYVEPFLPCDEEGFVCWVYPTGEVAPNWLIVNTDIVLSARIEIVDESWETIYSGEYIDDYMFMKKESVNLSDIVDLGNYKDLKVIFSTSWPDNDFIEYTVKNNETVAINHSDGTVCCYIALNDGILTQQYPEELHCENSEHYNTGMIIYRIDIVRDLFAGIYSVDFKVGDEIYLTKTTTNNVLSGEIENPTKEGYEFIGWSLDGTTPIENINSYAFTENTTLLAIFGKYTEVQNIWGSYSFSISQFEQTNYLFTTTVSDAETFATKFNKCFNMNVNELANKKFKFTMAYTWYDEGGHLYIADKMYTSLEEAQSSIEAGEMALVLVDGVVHVTFKYGIPKFADGTEYDGYLTQPHSTSAYIQTLEICEYTT